MAKVLQKLENNKSVQIISPDPEGEMERFCALMDQAPAAGGVVANPRGEVLLIRRKQRWDLPKGHIEAGESAPEGAVREVEEECSIRGVRCGKLICVTRHAYLLDGRWTLKRCEWYGMRYEGSQEPVPQTEEGIEQVHWAGPAELDGLLEGSYQTIRDVLKSYHETVSFV